MLATSRTVRNHPFWTSTPESSLRLIYDDPEISDSTLKWMEFRVLKMHDLYEIKLVQTNGRNMWKLSGSQLEARKHAKWWVTWYGKWTKIDWTNTEIDIIKLVGNNNDSSRSKMMKKLSLSLGKVLRRNSENNFPTRASSTPRASPRTPRLSPRTPRLSRMKKRNSIVTLRRCKSIGNSQRSVSPTRCNEEKDD